MSHNFTNGRTFHTSRDAMADYDRLPKALREALANANHNWSASQIYLATKTRAKGRKRYSTAEVLARVVVNDQRKADAYYAHLESGARFPADYQD
jgi:hypothetical protein